MKKQKRAFAVVDSSTLVSYQTNRMNQSALML